MSEWSNYYSSRIGEGYLNYALKRYQSFIDVLLNNHYTKFREEGCGIGTISKALLRNRPDVDIEMFDFDSDQVNLASVNIGLNVTRNNLLNHQSRTEVIFSHGVLEHFSNNEINTIINRQMDESSLVVHYVPTDAYKIQSFGDERLLSVEYWVNKFSPSSYFTFNNDYDLCLIFSK